MLILETSKPLEWGSLDLPLSGLFEDWYGKPLRPPAAFCLARDQKRLWFIAGREAPAAIHPLAAPGAFTENLWKFDTAELFLTHPDCGTYMELNLTANGAWWASLFSRVRQPRPAQPDFRNHITAHHEEDREGGWLAAVSIPVDFLEREIGLGSGSRANATFILNSPCQTFHSACKLPGPEPDFHQPAAMSVLETSPLET